MKTKIFFLFLLLALGSCGNSDLLTDRSDVSKSAISSSEKNIEQVPSTLSIEHFSRMKLVGTGLTLTEVQEKNSAYTRYGIRYSSNGLSITGILNIPAGSGPFPLVIFNHGYIDPKIYTNGRGLKREQDFLAREGFAVLHTDYRGHAGSDKSPDTRDIYDAGLEYAMDSVNAILAVREARIPGVDAMRVGMLGHSLGGGVSLNIAVARPDLISALILYAPVNGDAWENFVRWQSKREEGDKTLQAFGTRDTHPELWDGLSASRHLESIRAPILLFHGTEDDDVPKAWSDDLSSELKALGKDTAYVVYEDEQHEFIRRWPDFMSTSSDFLRRHLAPTNSWKEPLDFASSRTTKKPFGVRVSPADSPITNERFSGYHTGLDYELLEGEEPHSVIVSAACTGEIVYKNKVSGYGGVAMQQCLWLGNIVTVLYGHLSLTSVTASVGETVSVGERLGTLGAGFSEETDNERAHLHFSIHKGAALELRGYAENPSLLSEWIDPQFVLNK